MKGFWTVRKYVLYLVLSILTVPAVILTFKFLSDVRLASVVTTGIFVFLTLILIGGELKSKTYQATMFGALGFLVFSLFPILYLRIISWESTFAEAQLLGFSGQMWHKFSNYVFIGLIASIVLDLYIAKKTP